MPKFVDDCVKALMADPKFKPKDPDQSKEDAAYAVCQTRYKQLAKGSTITLETVAEPVSFLVAADDGGEILRFRNAILVVAEENQNQDVILEEELQNLAATLPGRAIDYDHQWQRTVGVFTEAHVVQVGGTWGLSVGGLIWADRFPEEAKDVTEGRLKLSIEADASTAECSVCGGVFERALDYCEHLFNKAKYGAKRILHGLKAVGGGLTPRPAGTSTDFDMSNVYFVAHHGPALIPEKDGKEIRQSPTEGDQKDKGGKPMPNLEELQKQLGEITAKYDSLIVARDEEKATHEQEVADLTAKVTDLATKVEELTGKLTQAQEKETDLITAHRTAVLEMKGLEKDDLEKQAEVYGAMTEAQFELLVAHVAPAQTPPPGTSGGFTPGGDGGTDKPVLTL